MKRGVYIIMAILLFLPLVAMVYLSFVSDWGFPDIWNVEITFRYWRQLFNGQIGLGYSFGLSLLLSLVIASSATAFGFLISKLLLFDTKHGGLLQLAFYPYLIAPVVFGAMLQFYFIRMGLAGSFLGVLLAQMLFVFPYAVLLQSTFWNDQIKQIAFQATTIGASRGQLFRGILLPMARPWLTICFVQCFLISWFEFGITELIGVGKVETLTISVMRFVREANPHYAALSACLLVLPLILMVVVGNRFFIKKTSDL